MYRLKTSGQFEKDYKRCRKQGHDMKKLQRIVDILLIPEQLPPKNRNHILSGNYAKYNECHIEPDWLLIYRYNNNYLELVRTGSHSELF